MRRARRALQRTNEAALAELDAVEGVGSGLFERVEVVTRSGVTTCWVYLFPNSTDGFERVHETWFDLA